MKQEIYALAFQEEDTHWWYAARRRILVELVARLARASGEPNRILDYGCGTGSILKAMQPLGEAYGIDMSGEAVQHCRQRGLDRVAHVPLEELIRYENPFDRRFHIVTMLDVLEHIPGDVGALRGIGEWIEPGGRVVIAVPAYEFLWSGEDYVSEHVRRYTASGLKRVVREAGFHVERCTYFNAFLLPVQLAVVLAKRVFDPRSMYVSMVRPTSPIVNTVLRTVFESERFFLPWMRFPAGGSLVCIGVKR
ncbi:MAG: hypothetical protein AMXMBFR84_10990 [Candidatus Hydrogenedentota bacterium]